MLPVRPAPDRPRLPPHSDPRRPPGPDRVQLRARLPGWLATPVQAAGRPSIAETERTRCRSPAPSRALVAICKVATSENFAAIRGQAQRELEAQILGHATDALPQAQAATIVVAPRVDLGHIPAPVTGRRQLSAPATYRPTPLWSARAGLCDAPRRRSLRRAEGEQRDCSCQRVTGAVEQYCASRNRHAARKGPRCSVNEQRKRVGPQPINFSRAVTCRLGNMPGRLCGID